MSNLKFGYKKKERGMVGVVLNSKRDSVLVDKSNVNKPTTSSAGLKTPHSTFVCQCISNGSAKPNKTLSLKAPYTTGKQFRGDVGPAE